MSQEAEDQEMVIGEGGGVEGPGGGGVGEGGGEGDDNAGALEMISDVVLTFMHSWFQGNNHQEIVKLAMSSFTSVQENSEEIP